ncbi:MAG: bL28 family ribosomal protein [Bacteroidaceae bacterium]|nr:bL28 family ribosomal protein [Bacteroidaceae bacterium]
MRRTKRQFNVNLFTKKFYYVEEDCWIVLKVSAAGLRIINRIGLDAALKQAVKKGVLEWKDIQVIG